MLAHPIPVLGSHLTVLGLLSAVTELLQQIPAKGACSCGCRNKSTVCPPQPPMSEHGQGRQRPSPSLSHSQVSGCVRASGPGSTEGSRNLQAAARSCKVGRRHPAGRKEQKPKTHVLDLSWSSCFLAFEVLFCLFSGNVKTLSEAILIVFNLSWGFAAHSWPGDL